MSTIALHSANGTRQTLHSPNLAGLLDASAVLEAMGANRLRGYWVLEGRTGELEALLADGALGLVLQQCSGRAVWEGEDLVHLGVRLAE